MTWSWIYGCANCTWQELAAICTLAVLAFAVWWCGLHWMARREKTRMELEKHDEDIKQNHMQTVRQ
jgi:hypothetical protein